MNHHKAIDFIFSPKSPSRYGMKTQTLKHGATSATTVVLLHTIIDFKACKIFNQDKIMIIEKRISKKASRETLAHRILESVSFNKRTISAKHPEIYRISEDGDEIRIFMEFIEGQELVVKSNNAYSIGLGLGEMSLTYSDFFHDEAPFDRGKTTGARFSASTPLISEIIGDPKEIDKIMDVFNKYNSVHDKILSWQSSARRTFCHNDIKSANAIEPAAKQGVLFYIIDWASPGYDSAGSDIGGLFLNSRFSRLEELGKNGEVETELFSGFADGFGLSKTASVMEELRIAANLHFAVRFLPWALRVKNKKMLVRVSRRAAEVANIFM